MSRMSFSRVTVAVGPARRWHLVSPSPGTSCSRSPPPCLGRARLRLLYMKLLLLYTILLRLLQFMMLLLLPLYMRPLLPLQPMWRPLLQCMNLPLSKTQSQL